MRKSTWLWLLLLSAVTLLPGIGLLATLEGCTSDDFLCFDPLLKAVGGFLIATWLVGSSIILFVAGARQGRKPEDSGPCPQCGRAVSAGTPTCLNCGYNLMRSPR